MVRLYSNENFHFPVVEQLRSRGHDVLTTEDAGQKDQSTPDEQVLAFAVAESRAVLTLNRKHFVKLHNTFPKHQGILVCTFDANFERQAERIHAAIESNGITPRRIASGESSIELTICNQIVPLS